jgi:RHS repeat-associated protein
VVVTDTNSLVKINRYSVWGETRDTAPLPTDLGYTGQEESSNLPIMYFNARWYDPSLSRFLQPDSMIPELYDPLSFDRYSYVGNLPINYYDPMGHDKYQAITMDADVGEPQLPTTEEYKISVNPTQYTEFEILVMRSEASIMSDRFKEQCGAECAGLTNAQMFVKATGGFVVLRDSTMVGCISNGTIYCSPNIDFATYKSHGLFTHEVGHIFGTLSGSGTVFGFQKNALYDNTVLLAGVLLVSNGKDYLVRRTAIGYMEDNQPYIQHFLNDDFSAYETEAKRKEAAATEEYADMFMNWVFNSFSSNSAGAVRYNFMNERMPNWIKTAVNR